ncbi:uncharacterized protein LOC118464517 [Anopheles albimanus]|uniref:uncharacterized protein LOC118464517 n=1 Tax=Anopheles albimanus TaxID=7167 RepID=UPI001641381A|nr:uncharacterized protein LOC118464517 [Anopheles albimanus]
MIQSKCLRIALGSMQSTHIMSLEVMAGVMPLKLRLEQQSLRYLIRSQVSNPLVIANFQAMEQARSRSKILNIFRDFVSLRTHPSALEAVNSAILPQSYSSLFSTDTSLLEETKAGPQSLRPINLFSSFVRKYGHIPSPNSFYTDGSFINGRTGFGVFNSACEASYRLQQPCSVYVAELAAVFYALLLISARPSDQYFIFTDSLSVVEALRSEGSVKSSEYFVRKILETLCTLFNKAFRISLVWLPAHCGIPGNEKADCLAKRGPGGSLFDRQLQPSEFLHLPQQLCLERWQKLWDDGEMGRFLYSISPQVSLRPWFKDCM